MTSRATILVVDDDAGVREMLEGLLASDERAIVLAADGAEGLARAEEIVPDLGLVDVVMPDLDGLEVCRRLRAHPRLTEVPVIMLTGEDVRLRALEAGVDDVVRKPFDPARAGGARAQRHPPQSLPPACRRAGEARLRRSTATTLSG